MNSLVQLLVKWECSRINVMVALVLLIHVYIWGTVVTCVVRSLDSFGLICAFQ